MPKERAYCLETLIRVGRKLSSDTSLTQRQILETIHQFAGDLLDARNMIIALYDRAADAPIYELVYQNGVRVSDSPADSAADIRMTREIQMFDRERARAAVVQAGVDLLIRWTLWESRPSILPSKRSWSAWSGLDIGKPTVGSWLCVPMMVGRKVLGAIAVYADDEWVYEEEDLNDLQALADYAAIALDNKEVNAQLRSLVEVGRELSSNIQLSENEILTMIRSSLRPLMRTDNMLIALHDEANKCIRVVMRHDKGVQQEHHDVIADDDMQRIWDIIASQEPLLHHTPEAGERWYQDVRQTAPPYPIYASYLGVPMITCGKSIGVIALYHPDQEYVFGDSDLDILQPIARYAAIALYNAQLYREARGDVLAAQKLATLSTAMGVIQHRVSNTLNFITPQLGSLRKRIPQDNPEVTEILNEIDQNVDFTSRLLTRLNQLALEGGSEVVQLDTILHRVIANAETRYRDVQFLLDIDPELPSFSASGAHLEEIFINLVENACRALNGSRPGQVMITAHYDAVGGVIQARVRDNGSGIDPQILSRLFVKPAPSASKSEGGSSSGLGLWLSRLILASMGGNIEVEETKPHQGTTLLVTLPVNGEAV
jgi:K+-sensing histidine kinase KdpD